MLSYNFSEFLQLLGSWIQTEMKLMINNDTHRIADLLINGCNMGIKSLSEYINKYKDASNESMKLARNLVKLEQEFMNELLAYLQIKA